jgi:hypothetical protein
VTRDDRDRAPDSSAVEGGEDAQTWGQGEGAHQPTIPDDEERPTTYAGGRPHELGDREMPLSRESEGMDR